VGATGTLVRITRVSEDRLSVSFEMRDGRWASFTSDEPTDFEVGAVFNLIENDDGSHRFESEDQDAWRERSWVGVVKLVTDDALVVDTSGQLRSIPLIGVACTVGDTVECDGLVGVTRVLSNKPIRYLDLGELDESVADDFESAPSGMTFDDFAGLDTVKERARELIEIPLQHADRLAAIGARPIKGVLFTGPPGTGKTHLARILASQAGATFFEVSGPEVFSKWYGDSEKLLRALFARASEKERSIIFFDEIDSLAGKRSDDSHEASKRVVATLLTLMDGFEPSDNIVVIAATNRPRDLDDALLRPGRFDWEIAFPLPDVHDRLNILELGAASHATSGQLDHAAMAQATQGWSGAELTAIWSEAAMLAVIDERDVITTEDYLGGYLRVDERKRLATGAWER
jgi:transitional endoplasmic reticulum ATPase